MTENNASESEPEEIDLGSLRLGGDALVSVGKGKKVEDTRARLAFSLLALLTAVLGLLFLLLFVHTIDAQQFTQLAGLLLAPLVGLVAAATGYYYGGER
ncbi:MAG TPA: hypothetical protein VGD55_04335 [Acidothermaceae bacterium]